MNVLPPDRHHQILRRGLDLMSVSGLAGITIGVLAEQIGMSKSGLFAHFGSKEDLQLALLGEAERAVMEVVLTPTMLAPEGLPQLQTLVEQWFGWTVRAGLQGGCPVAAGIFELDDQTGAVRERLVGMEQSWRASLTSLTARAVELGHLRPNLDVEQFVWELSGLYLSHHVSVRFLCDAQAGERAQLAFSALLGRSGSADQA